MAGAARPRTRESEKRDPQLSLPARSVESELSSILKSRGFVRSERMRRFLQFIVRQTLNGQAGGLKEYPVGVEVFDRSEAFDPRTDSIVRVEARRLRGKLEKYYQEEGRDARVVIELDKGSYVPRFRTAALPQQRAWRILALVAFVLVLAILMATR